MGLLVCTAWTAFGQATPAGPAFEVASVKPAAPVAGAGTWKQISSSDPSQVAYNNATLRSLLMRAYKVRDYQISGPDWLTDQRYDVAAKLPDNAPTGQAPLMLQVLLAERFKLTLHHEQKEMPAYALAVAKGGLKLKPVNGPPGGMNFKFGGPLMGMGGKVTMEGLAAVLADMVGTPIVNTTGIDGTFDIHLECSPDDRQTGMAGMKFTARDGGDAAPGAGKSEASSAPSLFSAVQSLGLKLEPRKAPMEILVIDHAEKAPVEN
jgi:uncharacterized protein (TIGR03435 family)